MGGTVGTGVGVGVGDVDRLAALGDPDCDGHPENVLTRDELLDNVMLYWINANGASSARIYWESFGKGPAPAPVTMAVTVAPLSILLAAAASSRAEALPNERPMTIMGPENLFSAFHFWAKSKIR